MRTPFFIMQKGQFSPAKTELPRRSAQYTHTPLRWTAFSVRSQVLPCGSTWRQSVSLRPAPWLAAVNRQWMPAWHAVLQTTLPSTGHISHILDTRLKKTPSLFPRSVSAVEISFWLTFRLALLCCYHFFKVSQPIPSQNLIFQAFHRRLSL